MSLKEKIDGNELDLSLNQLTEVPVKELAAATKATRLDISCNRIRSLPREFSTLTHLVNIDLSSNNLVELPDNFGNLSNLQYLDLYSNQLVTLPVSFCRLKKLIWLDLKNNPLEPKLKAVAGDCLDEKECQTCAKKVVAFMQGLDSELEREKQKKLKIAREKEALEKAKIEKELEEQRRIKKMEREKRKAESKAKKEAQLLSEKYEKNNSENASRLIENMHEKKTENLSAKGNYFYLKFLIISVFAICILLFIYGSKENNFSNFSMMKIFAQNKISTVQTRGLEFFNWLKLHFPSIRENILKIIHQYLILMTDFATYLEEMLSHYFR